MPHPAQLWLSAQLDPVRRRLGRPATFQPLPAPVFENTPRRLPCRPALFDPAHLSRVTKCGFGRTVSELAEVLSTRSYVEGPLATYRLGPATVLGGMIFMPQGRTQLSHLVRAGLRDSLATGPLQDDTILINSEQGLQYFGHWLSDDVSAFEAFRGDERVRSLPLPAWGDVTPYLDLFDQHWRQQRAIATRNLTLVRDLGFGRRKAQRYRTLRERLRSRIGLGDGAGKVVFLKRGPSGAAREIANPDALERRLSAAGVRIVTAEGGAEFIRALLDAAVIITIEGSQDRHALYALRDGGGMVTLAPPDRFYVATHEWARNLDMHSGIVVGTVAEGGFVIDPDEVLAMVDRLLGRSENREAV